MTQVRFTWHRRPSQPSAEPLRHLVKAALDRLERGNSEVHILVTDDQQVQELNHQYRGCDAATDVLSFADGDELPSGRLLLGEIVISLDASDEGEMDALELDLRRELPS